MVDEMGVVEGTVPRVLGDAVVSTPHYDISTDAFLLRLPSGLRFFYRRGQGTIFERPDSVSEKEVLLFFDGSIYGAIAWLNGLMPLHASAVAYQGEVHAFTGPSREGKSTLVAALAQRGFTIVTDDVLVLDPSDPAAILALPGHMRVKLWGEALALTGQQSTDAVRPMLDKFYVSDGIVFTTRPLPLRRLYVLERSSSRGAMTTPIDGARRISAFREALYRPYFGSALRPRDVYFRSLARLAQSVETACFTRSSDLSSFDDGVDFIAAEIRRSASPAVTPHSVAVVGA